MTGSGSTWEKSSRKGRSVSNDSGITLAEISVTLSAFAVLLLAVVPVLSRLLDVYHLRGAAHQMYAELQRVRLAAVMQNNRYRLSVGGASGEYVIHDDKNNDDTTNDGIGTVVTRSLDADSPGIQLTANNVITFAPNGSALTVGTINVSNRSGAVKTISVGAGGRIRLQ